MRIVIIGDTVETAKLVIGDRSYPIPVTGADAQQIEEETGVQESKIWGAIDAWSGTPCEYWRGCDDPA